MKKVILALPIAVSMLFMTSCSDDSSSTKTQPDPLATYTLANHNFNLTDAKTVTFEEYFTRSFQDTIAPYSTQSGNIKYTKDTTINNIPAQIFTKTVVRDEINPNIVTREIYQVSADANQFFVHSSTINSLVAKMVPGALIELPFQLPDMMVKVGDRVNETWTIDTKQITDFEVQNNIGPVMGNGTVTVSGKRGALSKVSIDNKDIAAQEFIITFKWNGTIAYVTDPASSLEVSVDLHLLLGEGKGIISYWMPYRLLDLKFKGQQPYTVPGWKYKVKTVK